MIYLFAFHTSIMRTQGTLFWIYLNMSHHSPSHSSIFRVISSNNLYDEYVQVEVGDKVWLGDVAAPSKRVGTGRVSGLGGTGNFHNRPIPNNYVKVNLESVLVNVPLQIRVEEADQVNLKDALGSSVLWTKDCVFENTED